MTMTVVYISQQLYTPRRVQLCTGVHPSLVVMNQELYMWDTA